MTSGSMPGFDDQIAKFTKFSPLGTVKESDRLYAFNQTGNFLVSTTYTGDIDSVNIKDIIPGECWKEFNRAAVFLAGLTRAMMLTNKTIHCTKAMRKVIDSSGVWVQMVDEIVEHEIKSATADVSTGLLMDLLGLAVPEASLVKYAKSLVQSVGKAAVDANDPHSKVRIEVKSEHNKNNVASMMVICENLFGVPFITLMVVSVDQEEVVREVNAGFCAGKSESSKLNMRKQLYYWVSPEGINKNAADIIYGMKSKSEAELVRLFKEIIETPEDDGGAQEEEP